MGKVLNPTIPKFTDSDGYDHTLYYDRGYFIGNGVFSNFGIGNANILSPTNSAQAHKFKAFRDMSIVAGWLCGNISNSNKFYWTIYDSSLNLLAPVSEGNSSDSWVRIPAVQRINLTQGQEYWLWAYSQNALYQIDSIGMCCSTNTIIGQDPMVITSNTNTAIALFIEEG